MQKTQIVSKFCTQLQFGIVSDAVQKYEIPYAFLYDDPKSCPQPRFHILIFKSV